MKKTKVLYCPCGEIDFKIIWESESQYIPEYCPFCSVPFDEDNNDDDDSENDED